MLHVEENEVVAAIQAAGYTCTSLHGRWYDADLPIRRNGTIVLPTGRALYSYGTLVSFEQNSEKVESMKQAEREHAQREKTSREVAETNAKPPRRWRNPFYADQADQL